MSETPKPITAEMEVDQPKVEPGNDQSLHVAFKSRPNFVCLKFQEFHHV